jgi:hypothetical protein
MQSNNFLMISSVNSGLVSAINEHVNLLEMQRHMVIMVIMVILMIKEETG